MPMASAAKDDGHIPIASDRIVGRSKLLGDRRDLPRRKQGSIRTEQACLPWAKPFVLFHGKRQPKETGGAEILAFLSHLAVQRNVAAAT